MHLGVTSEQDLAPVDRRLRTPRCRLEFVFNNSAVYGFKAGPVTEETRNHQRPTHSQQPKTVPSIRPSRPCPPRSDTSDTARSIF